MKPSFNSNSNSNYNSNNSNNSLNYQNNKFFNKYNNYLKGKTKQYIKGFFQGVTALSINWNKKNFSKLHLSYNDRSNYLKPNNKTNYKTGYRDGWNLYILNKLK